MFPSLSVRALLLAAAAALPMAAQAYDAAADFSTAVNANGVWSYGYAVGADTPPTSFTLFDHGAGWGWDSTTYQSLGAPAIWVNAGNTTLYGIAPGQMSLHPGEAAYSPAIVRFTAPAAATYNFSVQFFAGDTGDMNGAVFATGSHAHTVDWFSSTNTNPTVIGQIYLQAGDTLDAAVGNNGSFYSGNTGVAFSISAVPEPGAAWMLAAGLIGVACWSRRRQA